MNQVEMLVKQMEGMVDFASKRCELADEKEHLFNVCRGCRDKMDGMDEACKFLLSYMEYKDMWVEEYERCVRMLDKHFEKNYNRLCCAGVRK